MKILDILEIRSDFSLISYHNKVLTLNDFQYLVELYYKKLKIISALNDKSTFILIQEENPMIFYPVLFALWKNENRVVFPNDSYMNSDHDIFYKYVLKVENKEVIVINNNFYNGFKLEENNLDTVVFSSGSTGKPKGIVHSKENFFQNAIDVQEKVNINSAFTITPLKPYLVSAFSHFLVHILSKSFLNFVDIDNLSEIDVLVKKSDKISLVGSPMHLILGVNYIPKNTKIDFFFSSGDFISTKTIKTLLERYSDSLFYKVYGLAELAGRFFINKIDSSNSDREIELIGDKLKQIEYKIDDDELLVKSNYLFSGYIINGEFKKSMEYHKSGDSVKVEQNGGKVLFGRKDREIKVAGNKISLSYLENQISSILKDDVVIITSQKHPVFGNLINLVIKSEKSYTKKDIISQLSLKLKKYELPHQYFKINQIPYTQTMKIDRNTISKQISNLEVIK